MTSQNLESVVNAQTQYQSNSRHSFAYYRPDLYHCGCPRWKPPEPTLEERIANSSIGELVMLTNEFPKLAGPATEEINRRLKAEYEGKE